MAKLSSYRMKEELLKLAWQKRGFQLHGKSVNLDHDYAPDVLKKRKEYAEAKSVLKEKKIRFQTPFPARLRVFYPEGTVVYGSAGEATGDMAKRGSRLLNTRNLCWSRFRSSHGERAGDRGTGREQAKGGATWKNYRCLGARIQNDYKTSVIHESLGVPEMKG